MSKAALANNARLFRSELKVFQRVAEAIDTPRALALQILARHGEWQQALDLETDQTHYATADAFADDYLVTELLKKNPRVPYYSDEADKMRQDKALAKFREAEELCKLTNLRFEQVMRGIADIDPETLVILKRAKRYIARILGPLTTVDLETVWARARFGPGATSDVKGRQVFSSEKYSTLGATPGFMSNLWKLLPTQWIESAKGRIANSVFYSEVIMVPKNAKIDRAICIEPHLNVFLQLGIGHVIREKLRAAGLDLITGQQVNAAWASLAQSLGLATVDLSSASDTIAKRLVEFLIPRRWLHLLRVCRTPMTKLPNGDVILLQKWSSMGNGYTFELETLIFWCLVRACCPPDAITSAYGDDLILPQASYDTLERTLTYCGFKVNRSKSFRNGRFFESCGTDWFDGVNVRPFYLRYEVKSEEDCHDAFIFIANQIRRYAHRRASVGSYNCCDARFRRAWLHARDVIPREWQMFIPDGVGDGGLVGNFDEAAVRYDRNLHCLQYTFRVRPARKRRPVNALGYLVSRLHAGERSLPSALPALPLFRKDAVVRAPSGDSRLSYTGDFRRYSCNAVSYIESRRGALEKPHVAAGHCARSAWPDLGPWA